MFNLPVFVGIDYHTNTLQVCVMNQQRKILVNQSVEHSPESVFPIWAVDLFLALANLGFLWVGEARIEKWDKIGRFATILTRTLEFHMKHDLNFLLVQVPFLRLSKMPKGPNNLPYALTGTKSSSTPKAATR